MSHEVVSSLDQSRIASSIDDRRMRDAHNTLIGWSDNPSAGHLTKPIVPEIQYW